MTIQNNFPAIKPSLNLDFANTKQLDPRITFARASTARFYDGKTTVKAEENLLQRSQEFDNAAWDKSSITVTANSTVAPDGTTTAETSDTGTAANTYHFMYQNGGFTANSTFTVSVYAKANTGLYLNISLFDAAASPAPYAAAIYNVSTGAVVTTKQSGAGYLVTGTSVVSVGSGWYRCTLACTVGSASLPRVSIQTTESTAIDLFGLSPAYTGTGVSNYIWGAQLEQRSFATAYTPTTTAPITNYIPVLQTAAAGTPRFDHNPVTGESLGLLIEEQRTNLLTYSSDFENIVWNKGVGGSVASNAVVAPDGTTTADIYTWPPSTGLYAFMAQSVSSTSTAAHTFSVWLKRPIGSGNRSLRLVVSDVNVSTGLSDNFVVTETWQRFTFTRTSANSTNYIGVGFAGASGLPPGIASGEALHIWGAQLELGAFATSYIPTALTYSGRASAATFRGPNGLIQTAAANVARSELNAGGGSNLLLETARSNLFTYTENFDNDIWGKNRVTVAPNQVVAPDGLVTADVLTSTTGTSDSIFQAFIASNVVHTVSFWIKGIGSTTNSAFGIYTTAFVPATATILSGPGTVSGTALMFITGLSEKEWTRVSFTTSAAFGAGSSGFYIYPGGGNTANTSVAVWGVQIETGSAATSYIPSLETFTGRASTATYYDSTGIIRSAASGQPRYSYNPALLSVAPKLLLEAQSTNLLTFSERFDDATWVKASSATVTANTAVAPDGTTTADTLTTIGGISQLYQQQLLSNGTYTYSLYVKRIDNDLFMLDLSDSSTGDAIVAYSLNTGSVASTSGGGSWTGVSGTITNVGNNWYRCTLTAGKGAGGSIIAKMQATTGSGSFYIWGAQLETGTAATSYIPTVASQVTRVADTSTSAAQSRAADVYSSSQVTRAADGASITGSNFSSWYNAGEGTLFVNATPSLVSASDGIVRFAAALYNNIAYSNAIRLERVSGLYRDVQTYNNTSGVVSNTWNTGAVGKLAGTYATNNSAAVFNGGTVGTISGNAPIGITELGIGGNSAGGNNWGGHIARIAYYPRRISDTQLQSLTT